MPRTFRYVSYGYVGPDMDFSKPARGAWNAGQVSEISTDSPVGEYGWLATSPLVGEESITVGEGVGMERVENRIWRVVIV